MAACRPEGEIRPVRRREGQVSEPRSTRLRNSRTSDSRKRRCPPRVRIAVSLPARAQRVTVLGLTRNNWATSEGVKSASSEWLVGMALQGTSRTLRHCAPFVQPMRVTPAVSVPAVRLTGGQQAVAAHQDGPGRVAGSYVS